MGAGKVALLVAAGAGCGVFLSTIHWAAAMIFNVAYFGIFAIHVATLARAAFGRFDDDPGLAGPSRDALTFETLRDRGLFVVIVKSHNTPREGAPAVIMHHGYGSTYHRLLVYAYPVALKGYAVVLYNAPGHGKVVKGPDGPVDERSPGDKTDVHEIMRAFTRMVDLVKARPDLGPVAVMGISLGAIVALAHGTCDPRVECVISLAGVHDFATAAGRPVRPLSSSWWMLKSFAWSGLEMRPTALQNNVASPAFYLDKEFGYFEHPVWVARSNARKVFLIHAEDDCTVPFSNLDAIVKALDLPPDHVLALRRGNHWFVRQEHLVIGQAIRWLDETIGTGSKV